MLQESRMLTTPIPTSSPLSRPVVLLARTSTSPTATRLMTLATSRATSLTARAGSSRRARSEVFSALIGHSVRHIHTRNTSALPSQAASGISHHGPSSPTSRAVRAPAAAETDSLTDAEGSLASRIRVTLGGGRAAQATGSATAVLGGFRAHGREQRPGDHDRGQDQHPDPGVQVDVDPGGLGLGGVGANCAKHDQDDPVNEEHATDD